MSNTRKKHRMGIIGCGDFLRLSVDALKKSTHVDVVALFDLNNDAARKYAAELGGAVVETVDEIFDDADIDIVCIFVPPWARRDLLTRAVGAGKHVLTTKPLGSSVEDCAAMAEAVGDKVRCCVIYRRTGAAEFETYKSVLDSGEVGKLALMRHDWIHHYPEWNQWATDPQKNGGPFMDAEVHQLNIVRYLMGRPATQCAFFSDNLAHPELKCGDTDFMKIDFEGNGSAYLFITWAADLEVYSKDGNYREHIDITYFVTDKGWRLTTETVEGQRVVQASRNGEIKTWPIQPLPGTVYDRFAQSIDANAPLPTDISDIRDAYEDIRILKTAEADQGQTVSLK